MAEKESSIKLVSHNRKARYDYEVISRYEAGIVLVGTEVKSIRNGMVNLVDSYAKFIQDELWLVNMHISEYRFGNVYNHEPRRSRKLLLHKKELNKLERATKEKGLTLIPMKLYLKNGKVKVEIGLCKGKKLYDKRESTKEKEMDREMRRIAKNYR
ncbi:MAG: SsrA-binding protein [bacterium]|nr:MAG: SsrA-binding protein [bacterium]